MCRVLAFFASAVFEIFDYLLVQVGLFAANGDQAIAVFTGELCTIGDQRRNINRDRRGRRSKELRLARLVVLAIVGNLLAAPQGADEINSLGQHSLALLIAWPPSGYRVFIERFTGSDAQVCPTRSKVRDRCRCLGNDRRVVAQDWAGHAGSQVNMTCTRGGRAKPCPAKCGLASFTPGVKVIAHVDQIKTCLLSLDCIIEQFSRRELLGPRLPS